MNVILIETPFFVQMEEIPPLPFLTDNHGINDSNR